MSIQSLFTHLTTPAELAGIAAYTLLCLVDDRDALDALLYLDLTCTPKITQAITVVEELNPMECHALLVHLTERLKATTQPKASLCS